MKSYNCLTPVIYQNTLVLWSIVIIITILSAGCHRHTVKVAPIPEPVAPDTPSVTVVNSHLHGWQQAEALYEKKLADNPTEKIKDKLRQIRFLILLRQIEENIPNPHIAEIIEDLCAGDERGKRLCEVAKWVQNGKKFEELKLNYHAFTEDDPFFESYLTLLLFQNAPQFDVFSLAESLATTNSPMFLYMNPYALISINPDEFEKLYPDFAEGFVVLAEQLFNGTKYSLSRKFYQKALELIPDYTKALSGIGDIYYAIEDYERALHYYNLALRHVPADITVLFRKGLTLHQFKRYEESNDVMDHMLRLDTAQDKQVGGTLQYYHGQGYYIKAYNHYLLNDRVKAREFVDSAKKLLPQQRHTEIRYLSGMLFYESQDWESARQEFMSLNGASCNASLHLGFIHEKLNAANENTMPAEKASEHESVPFFIEAATCMRSEISLFASRINNFDLSAFEPVEQERIKSNLNRKLLNLKNSSSSDIKLIIDRIDEYVSGSRKRELSIHLDSILKSLDRY